MHQVGQLGLVVGLGGVVGKVLGHQLEVDVVPVDLAAKVVGAGDHHNSRKDVLVFLRDFIDYVEQ